MRNFFFFLSIFILGNTISSFGQRDTVIIQETSSVSEPVEPDCGCDTLWEKPDTKEFIELLEKSTSGHHPVWPGYSMEDGSYIIDAGQLKSGEHCFGLWQKGKLRAYACFDQTLRMLTPLYSYFLQYPGMDTIPSEPFFHTADKAPAFKIWMENEGVSSAVYMPMDFSKLPFTIPTYVKVQLATHEAFHIEVMMRYWFTKKGAWPSWDKQPDRPGVQVCYTYEDSARTQIQKELGILADMVEALLDGKKDKACLLGGLYLTAREARYQRLKNVTVKLADGVEGDCSQAESLMELEEGLADYASWGILYNNGFVSKADLLKRYRAQQKDHFYLSGCMLMHAVVLMSGEDPNKTIQRIVKSSSLKDGSLLDVFSSAFEKYCK